MCPAWGQHWIEPIYRGRIFRDFRRSAAHEMWKSGSSEQDCMETAGHETFRRYADLFSRKRNLLSSVKFSNGTAIGARQDNVISMPKPVAVPHKNAHKRKESKTKFLNYQFYWLRGYRFWCGRGDLNPHAFRRHPLKMVCLPVPPLPHAVSDLCSIA